MRFDNPIRKGPYRQGIRTVLLGDSMTDWYQFGTLGTLTSAIYDTSTGLLTLTASGAHQIFDQVYARIWHYTYDSMRDHFYVPLTFVSSTVMTANIGAGLSGVPGTDIKSGLYVYTDNTRAIASFINWLQMMMGWPLNIVRNAAQSGDTVAGNVRRLARDIVAYSPDLVIGHSPGINDLRSADARSESDIIGDLTQLYDGILATGALLAIGTLSPVSSAEADRAYRTVMQTMMRVNDWIRSYALNHPGMIVVDHYRNFIDISNASGFALSARVRNDGIHPATKTAILNAKLWAAVLGSRLPPSDLSLPKSIMDCHPNSRITVSSASASGGVVTVNSTSHRYRVGEEFRALGGSQALANGWFTVASVPGSGSFTYSAPGVPDGAITGLLISRSRNLFTNPLLQTTTGGTVGSGFTGTAAGNMSVSTASGSGCTAVASVASAVNVGSTAIGYSTLPPPVGNEQVLAISAASTGNRPQIGSYGTTAFGTQMLFGRSYVFECILRIQSTDWTATMISNLLLQFEVQSNTVYMTNLGAYGQDTSETNAINEDMRIHVRSPVLKVNEGSSISSAVFTIGATIQAAFSAGPVLTLGVSQVNVIDVTGDEANWG